jgi:hypothetical protein
MDSHCLRQHVAIVMPVEIQAREWPQNKERRHSEDRWTRCRVQTAQAALGRQVRTVEARFCHHTEPRHLDHAPYVLGQGRSARRLANKGGWPTHSKTGLGGKLHHELPVADVRSAGAAGSQVHPDAPGHCDAFLSTERP